MTNMNNIEFNCEICGSDKLDKIDYLKNMSIKGKIFRWIPLWLNVIFPSSLKRRFVHGKTKISVFKDRKWLWCKSCKFGVVFPMPSTKELDNYYHTLYWENTNNDSLKDIVYSLGNTTRPKRQLDFIKNSGLHNVDNMLDFGAGILGGSVVFRDAGFSSLNCALDKSEQTSQVSKMLKMRNIFNLDECVNSEFDFIYSSHSLEHVASLKHVLNDFHRVLTKSGHIFIEVPNFSDDFVMKNHHHAPHTYVFSLFSLQLFMESNGFIKVSSELYEDSGMSLFRKIV